MQPTLSEPPPISVPRLNSLLCRLQHLPDAEDESRLDQLMIFLEDAPEGVRDRWKEGAAMCTGWGVPCTGASVWRLYRSYALEWRLRLAEEASAVAGAQPKSLSKKIKLMIARRTFEILANPQSPQACLVDLARIELRKQAVELARQQQKDRREDQVQLAIDALTKKARGNWEATFALGELKKALHRGKQLSRPPLPPALQPCAASAPANTGFEKPGS